MFALRRTHSASSASVCWRKAETVATAVTATRSAATLADRPATTRLRAHHRQARRIEPIGRAAIGSPASQRSRSVGHRLGRGITPARVFLEAFQTDRLEVAVDPRNADSGRHRLLFAYLPQRLVDRVGLKRRSTREQLVQDCPQPVDVGRGGDLGMMAGDLLGRHVRGGPENQTGLRQAAVAVDALGESKIGDVGNVVFVEQDVRRLQVAVQDSAEVGIMNGTGDVPDQPGDGSRVVPEPGHVALEVSARDQLEAQERAAAVLAHLVDRHDLRMIEAGDRLGLDTESLDRVGAGLEGR